MWSASRCALSTSGPKKKNRAPARMLFADDGGRIFDHPDLLALGQSWRELMPLATPLLRQEPPGSQVVFLPGRRPVGLDPESGQAVVLEEVELEGATIRPHAVAATPPPGYLRHALPAMRERSVRIKALKLNVGGTVEISGSESDTLLHRADST